MRAFFFTYFITALLILPQAWADQTTYENCKETALNNLVNRYRTAFQSETGMTLASSKASTYLTNFTSAKAACGAANFDCIDGAINTTADRFSENFQTDAGVNASSISLEKYQSYQNDYSSSANACNQYLNNNANCITHLQQEITTCNTDHQSAITACDYTQDAGMNSVQSSLNGITNSGGTAGVQQACQTVNTATTQGSQAVSAYKQNCSTHKATCSTSCEAALQKLSSQCSNEQQSTTAFQTVHTNSNDCDVLQAKDSDAQDLLNGLESARKSSLNCANQTGTAAAAAADPTTAAINQVTQAAVAALTQPAAAATPVDPSTIPSTDPNSAYCLAHPGDAGCVASCSRTDLPAIASSPTCICVTNPSSPSCNAAAAAAASSLSGLNGGGTTTAATTTATSASDLNLADAPFAGLGDVRARNHDGGQQVGGRQGAGAMIGGGSGPMPSAARTKSSGGAEPVIARVSSGGGGGGMGGGLSNGNSGGGSATAGASSDPTNAKQQGPDLRQFLPGGKLAPQRGVAGIVGEDGITGPEGSNWSKTQNRFNSLSPTLLPP